MLKDLTVGKPLPVLVRLSMPLLLSMALQQIYNIADTMVVGRILGADALAAIGASYPITLIYVACATGASMGASVIISQLFGAHDYKAMKSAIYTAIISLSILGFLIAGLGAILSKTILSVLGTPDSIIANSVEYLWIYSMGVFPMFVYNIANAVFTGLGDTRRPLIFLAISSVLNIILDIYAVTALNLGVGGAAWATLISQLLAAVLSNIVLVGRINKIQTNERPSFFDLKLLGQMSRIAVPSILQQSCVAISHTILQSLVNNFGDVFIAGYTAASKIHNFTYMCFNTMGVSLSSFTAQNHGAKKLSRIRQGFKISNCLCFSLSLLAVIILQLFPAQLVGLFVDSSENADIIAVGVRYLRIISPNYLVICFIITGGGLLRGLGRINEFLFLTITDLSIRVIMSFVLSSFMGYTGLFWAWYFGSIPDALIIAFIYRYKIVRQNNI